jgi:4-hydroxy-2-oxoheptanedioate aldolase
VKSTVAQERTEGSNGFEPSTTPADRISAFREAFAKKQVTYGGECSIPSPYSVELMGYAGFDWLFMDLEHSPISIDQLVPMLQASSITRTPMFVRVPWLEPGIIMRVLDAGAVGVVVPMVNSPEEAEQAVAACRYPPDGIRSWGPFRSPDGPGFRQQRAAGGAGFRPTLSRALCMIQIETVAAVERVEEIVSVPGVDGVFVGVMDLALSGGLPMVHPNEDPVHVARIERIGKACTASGVTAAIHTHDHPGRWRDAGFRMLMVGSDEHGVVSTAHAALERAREKV